MKPASSLNHLTTFVAHISGLGLDRTFIQQPHRKVTPEQAHQFSYFLMGKTLKIGKNGARFATCHIAASARLPISERMITANRYTRVVMLDSVNYGTIDDSEVCNKRHIPNESYFCYMAEFNGSPGVKLDPPGVIPAGTEVTKIEFDGTNMKVQYGNVITWIKISDLVGWGF